MKSSVLKLIILGSLVLAAYGAYRVFESGENLTVVFTGGQTVRGDQVKQPLKVQPVPHVRVGDVVFDFRVTDADGQPINRVRLAGGRDPGEPTITITDASGKVLHTGKYQYG